MVVTKFMDHKIILFAKCEVLDNFRGLPWSKDKDKDLLTKNNDQDKDFGPRTRTGTRTCKLVFKDKGIPRRQQHCIH